jgi:radical SAM protein with 4Fe4S-binding SPASM domain
MESINHSFPHRVFSRLRQKYQPISFSCELTTKCNIRCDFCTRTAYTEKRNKKEDFHVKDMADETVDRVLEELEKFYKRGIPIVFSPMGLGEPLIFGKLFEVFERVKKISPTIPINLTTNGITLNRALSEKILATRVDEVSISLNADNAYMYEDHMGIDKYEIVRENIQTLFEVRKKNQSKLPHIYIQYLDYDNNPKTFSKDASHWRKMMKDGDKCYIHPILNHGGFYKNSNLRVVSPEHYPCYQPKNFIAIRVNGDLYPCCPAFYAGGERVESLYLGNIKSKSPFEMYNEKNSKADEIVSCMRKNDYTKIPTCDKCNTYRISPNIYFKLPFSLKLNGYKWI